MIGNRGRSGRMSSTNRAGAQVLVAPERPVSLMPLIPPTDERTVAHMMPWVAHIPLRVFATATQQGAR